MGYIPPSSSNADKESPVTVSTKECILSALKCGYRFFDCAQFYGNENLVGEAIRESNVDRADLFLVSKVWNDTIFAGKDAVIAQVKKCLKDLGKQKNSLKSLYLRTYNLIYL